MIGITSYGGYLPRLRLSRKSIAQAVSWLAPGVAGLAQGEKAVCNWDEDTVTMAVAASRDALVGKNKDTVDGLYLASTTLPFADRLNAGIVATALNLQPTIMTADFCSSLRAGTSAMIAGLGRIKSGEEHCLLVASADHRKAKAASNQEMLFGDGAAAVLLGDEEVIAEFKGSHTVSYDFVDHYRGTGHQFDINWEERWVRDEGYLKIVPEAVRGLLAKLDLPIDKVDKLVIPCPFKGQHATIAKALGLDREKVIDNMHAVCGETGAAHPLVMLVAALENANPGEIIVVGGFGQGCDALCFEVTENIAKLAPRAGIRGSLADKRPMDNYFKYLNFRGLVETEAHARTDVPMKTALSTLWRNRKMLLALVGGRCRECGTPQFPSQDICVKPDCGAIGTQDEYEFANVPAIVKSFTGDMGGGSIDPPGIYGIVQFEGGGRFLADFTDCDIAQIVVGMPVRMSFRVHIADEERGFTGYFWKAVPDASRT